MQLLLPQTQHQGLWVPCLVLPAEAQGTRERPGQAGGGGRRGEAHRQSRSQSCVTAGRCCHCYCCQYYHRCTIISLPQGHQCYLVLLLRPWGRKPGRAA